jgi:two-component system phosphate regulon sensor histidine kinase PhoR
MLNQSNNLDSSLSYYINKINKQVMHLQKQTNTLLDKNKLEKSHISGKSLVSFIDIVKRIIERLQPEIMQKSVQIKTINLNKTIYVDENLFEIAIFNIFENAVKNSKDKGIVEIKLVFEKGFFEVYIKDYGTGIAPADIENIFKPYYQINSNEENGQGIGLYIAKNIVEKHNGKIVCESKLGIGSTFKIILPNITNE